MPTSNLTSQPVHRGIIRVVECTPTLTVAGAYSANDYIGTSGVAWEFPNAVREPGGWGTVEVAVLIDRAASNVNYFLLLFDAPITPPDDNATWVISDADAAKFCGDLVFSTKYSNANNIIMPKISTGLAFRCAANQSSLYGVLYSAGGPTLASGDLTIRLTIRQE